MENNKRIINGYLECDGSIVKITSFEEIKAFITKFGKSISEMTESELDALTEQSDNPKIRNFAFWLPICRQKLFLASLVL